MKNPYLDKFQQNPLSFAYAYLIPPDVKLYKEQEQIIESTYFEPETYVKSYHSAGKTYTAAIATLTFLFLKIPSKVITTAPSWPQVEKLLWSEINSIYKQAYERNKDKGTVLSKKLPLTTEFRLADDWFAIGLSPKIELKEGSTATRIQGFHSEHLLFVMDEAPAVDPRIWEIKDALLTGQDMHGLYIGNPVDSSGEFYRCFQDSGKKRITLNIFESPNFAINGVNDIKVLKKLVKIKQTDPRQYDQIIRNMQIPYPALATPNWAVGRYEKWGGEQGPLFMARVLSQFPDTAPDSMIALSDLEACTLDKIDPRPGPNVLGCDVARFGDDNTCIFGIKHWKQADKIVYNGKDTVRTANELIHLWRKDSGNAKERYNIIVVDDIGVGGGVVDNLNDFFKGKAGTPRVIGVGSNYKPSTQYADTCKDTITELFKRTDELLKAREIALEDSGELFAQLTNRKYDYKQGLLVMESKEDYKKRTGLGSPDEGDACLLAIYGLTRGATKARTKGLGNSIAQKGW